MQKLVKTPNPLLFCDLRHMTHLSGRVVPLSLKLLSMAQHMRVERSFCLPFSFRAPASDYSQQLASLLRFFVLFCSLGVLSKKRPHRDDEVFFC